LGKLLEAKSHEKKTKTKHAAAPYSKDDIKDKSNTVHLRNTFSISATVLA